MMQSIPNFVSIIGMDFIDMSIIHCAMQQMPDCPFTFVQLLKGYRPSCLDEYDINFVSFTEAFILLSKYSKAKRPQCTKLQYHHPRRLINYNITTLVLVHTVVIAFFCF